MSLNRSMLLINLLLTHPLHPLGANDSIYNWQFLCVLGNQMSQSDITSTQFHLSTYFNSNWHWSAAQVFRFILDIALWDYRI
jgi:hypothetical protein